MKRRLVKPLTQPDEAFPISWLALHFPDLCVVSFCAPLLCHESGRLCKQLALGRRRFNHGSLVLFLALPSCSALQVRCAMQASNAPGVDKVPRQAACKGGLIHGTAMAHEAKTTKKSGKGKASHEFGNTLSSCMFERPRQAPLRERSSYH